MNQNDQISKTIEPGEFEIGQAVEGIVESFSPLGINVLIDNKYEGLAYGHETFKDTKIGEKVTVYIKHIREDGRLDLSFQKQGYRNYIGTSTEIILQKLKDAGGSMPFSDKSKPEAITDEFQMSKKVFKQSIGALYRERKIVITEDSIKLA